MNIATSLFQPSGATMLILFCVRILRTGALPVLIAFERLIETTAVRPVFFARGNSWKPDLFRKEALVMSEEIRLNRSTGFQSLTGN